MTVHGLHRLPVASRVIFAAMAVPLGWAAALQFNDADPLLWTALYGAGALLCGVGALGRALPSWVGGAFAVGCVGYAAYLGVFVLAAGEGRPMFDGTAPEEARLIDLEEGRELLGLLILAASSAGHAWVSRRARLPGTG
jgi:hypothetical protein